MRKSSSITKILIFLVLLIGILYILYNPYFNTFYWFGDLSPTIFTFYTPDSFPFSFWNYMPRTHLFFLIIWLIVTVWVYHDAEQRNMNGVLWGLLVLVGNLVGFIVYLLVRRDPGVAAPAHSVSNACPNCHKAIENDFIVCPYCQIKLKNVCPSCGKPTQTGWAVCPYCKTDL